MLLKKGNLGMNPSHKPLLIIFSFAFLIILLGIYNINSGIKSEFSSVRENVVIELPDIIIKTTVSLDQAGFHLHFKGQLEIKKNNNHINLTENQITMQWNLPADVLVDVNTLMRSNPGVSFRTSRPVDVEKATHHSQPFTLYACFNADYRLELDIEFNARYPMASSKKFHTFSLHRPVYNFVWDQNLGQNIGEKALITSSNNARTFKFEELNNPLPLKITIPAMPDRREYFYVTIGVHSILASLLILFLIAKK